MRKREGQISCDPGWEGLLKRRREREKENMGHGEIYVVQSLCRGNDEMITDKFMYKRKERDVNAAVSCKNKLQKQQQD